MGRKGTGSDAIAVSAAEELSSLSQQIGQMPSWSCQTRFFKSPEGIFYSIPECDIDGVIESATTSIWAPSAWSGHTRLEITGAIAKDLLAIGVHKSPSKFDLKYFICSEYSWLPGDGHCSVLIKPIENVESSNTEKKN